MKLCNRYPMTGVKIRPLYTEPTVASCVRVVRLCIIIADGRTEYAVSASLTLQTALVAEGAIVGECRRLLWVVELEHLSWSAVSESPLLTASTADITNAVAKTIYLVFGLVEHHARMLGVGEAAHLRHRVANAVKARLVLT